MTQKYDDPPPELPSRLDVLECLLVTLTFLGGGIVGAVVADAVAHADSDYMYGVGVGPLVAGFFIGGVTVVLLMVGLPWWAWRRANGRANLRRSGDVVDDLEDLI